MTPWLVLLALSVAPASSQEEASDPASGRVPADAGFVVVVNALHAGTAIRREELESIFLRRAERWGDGRPIEPADQSLRSEVRAAFSRRVLGLEPGAVLQYWQSQLQRGTGVRPPPVKKSDAEVIAWVGEVVGRIGYVTPGAALGEQVKTVSVLE